MTETFERVPEDWPELSDSVMSNFDHKIDWEVAEKLKEGGVTADYPGWNFYGQVWYSDGKYRCEVTCYCVHQTTLVSDSLQEIMDEASSRWGAD